MKKIIVLIFIMMLMPFRPSVDALDGVELSREIQVDTNTLITEWGNNQVIEVDNQGNEVWNKTGLNLPNDAKRLPNGNTLITVHGDQTVIEVDRNGNEVWNKSGLILPLDAERLENGNTLIAEYGGGRVTEVDKDYNIVWQKNGLHKPHAVERLPNNNTLIVEAELYPDGRIIEVDIEGNIVWQKTELNGPVDVERLDNGNTLITEHVGDNVTEIDINGTIIWQKTGLEAPKDAERLANGNTLIAECGGNRVIEVDSTGNEVWNKTGLFYPVDVERLPNQQPYKPAKPSGPINGKVGTSYIYETSTTDPERDFVYYWFDWGDGINSGWIGPFESGAIKSTNHTWTTKGNYNIKVKARDIYNHESDWSNPLTVKMPRNRFVNNVSQRFLLRMSNLYLIVRQLLR
jgi:hypothetical protein